MFRVNQRLNLVLMLVLVLSLTIGVTAAYITSIAIPLDIDNSPRVVACDVTATENTYTIKNTGNVDAYIRVAVVANWVSEETDDEGNATIYWTTPEYTVTLKNTNTTKWQKYGDYYYCLSALSSAEEQCEMTFATVTIDDVAPTGYTGKIQVIAQAIQASEEATSNGWGVNITTEGVSAVA